MARSVKDVNARNMLYICPKWVVLEWVGGLEGGEGVITEVFGWRESTITKMMFFF